MPCAWLGLDVPELTTEAQRGESLSVDLTIAGVPMEDVQVHALAMIYDCNFGARFLSENVVTPDFEPQQIWIAPR